MAEVDRIFGRVTDADGNAFTMITVVEDTQFTTDPKGRFSPMVVSVKITNTSSQRGQGVWQSPNGVWNDNVVLPGENMEQRIAPARQEYLHLWSATATARWG